MKNICDLYLNKEVDSYHFKYLSLFDKTFIYIPQKLYSGYLGLNVERIKLVSVVIALRKEGIEAINVPVIYRDGLLLSRVTGFDIAKKHALLNGYNVMLENINENIPLCWSYIITNHQNEKVGGVVHVDKLDGHIWTSLEYEEYMYDYNNIL
ncbi:MAG: hypothetical protein ACK5M5_14665 [Limnobaculum xujianqingii]